MEAISTPTSTFLWSVTSRDLVRSVLIHLYALRPTLGASITKPTAVPAKARPGDTSGSSFSISVNGEIKGVARAKRKPYIPVVLSRQEIDLISIIWTSAWIWPASYRMAVGSGSLNVLIFGCTTLTSMREF